MAPQDEGMTRARMLLAGVLPATAIAVWSASQNVYEPIKWALLVLAAAGLAVLMTRQAIVIGRVPRLPRLFAIAAGGLTLALLIATITSRDPLLSLIGVQSRYGGLVTYVAVVVIALIAAAVADHPTARAVLAGVCVGLAAVAAIGLLQRLGVGILEGRGSSIGVASTLGNSNFASAWAGAGLAAVTWLGLADAGWGWRRQVAVLLGILTVVFIVATGALQGIPAAAAAVTPLLLVWATRSRRPLGRALAAGWLAALALGAALLVSGLAGVGPAAALAEQTGIRLRGFYWQAALAMFGDHPLMGVGLDGYGAMYRRVRTPEAATAVELTSSADAAHSVPLHFLAGGGLVLGLAYLAFVVITGMLLLRGLRRLRGQEQLALAGVAGMWLAYQTQSLVSIDVPALMALHAVTAGVGVGLATAPQATWRLPWALGDPEPSRRPGQRKKNGGRQQIEVPLGRRVGATVMSVTVVIAAVVVAVQPLRAEMALRRALAAEASNALEPFVIEAERAAEIGFWDPVYTHRAGFAHQRVGTTDQAVEYYRQADARGGGVVDSAYSAALALKEDDPDAALPWYRRALELEPNHPDVLRDAAAFLVDTGHGDEAEALIARLLQQDPEDAEAQRLQAQLGG